MNVNHILSTIIIILLIGFGLIGQGQAKTTKSGNKGNNGLARPTDKQTEGHWKEKFQQLIRIEYESNRNLYDAVDLDHYLGQAPETEIYLGRYLRRINSDASLVAQFKILRENLRWRHTFGINDKSYTWPCAFYMTGDFHQTRNRLDQLQLVVDMSRHGHFHGKFERDYYKFWYQQYDAMDKMAVAEAAASRLNTSTSNSTHDSASGPASGLWNACFSFIHAHVSDFPSPQATLNFFYPFRQNFPAGLNKLTTTDFPGPIGAVVRATAMMGPKSLKEALDIIDSDVS